MDQKSPEKKSFLQTAPAGLDRFYRKGIPVSFKPSLTEMKTLLAAKNPEPTRPERLLRSRTFSSVLRSGGLYLIEGPVGSGKLEWLNEYFKENPPEHLAWIEPRFQSIPWCFAENPQWIPHCVAIEAGDQKEALEWVVREVTRSGLFSEVLILAPFSWNISQLKRLHLAARQSQSILFFLSDRTQPGSRKFLSGAWKIVENRDFYKTAILPDGMSMPGNRLEPLLPTG